MKLLIFSDLHLEFASFAAPAKAVNQADLIVLAGDIDVGERGVLWAMKLGKPVVYVPGNHEFYNHLGRVQDRAHWLRDMRLRAGETSTTVLDREQLLLGNVRFLGATLWTDFQLQADGPGDRVAIDRAMADGARGLYDFSAIGEDGRTLRPEDTAREHMLSRAWLLERLAEPWHGKTILVTHHAPSARSAAPRWFGHPLNPCFASELPAPCFAGVDLWIHGHMHDGCDYEHHGCRVVCNPRGYPLEQLRNRARAPSGGGVHGEGYRAFDPTLLIEV